MANILLVEDEPQLRKLIATALTRAGHTVETAEDGRVAAPIVASRPLDLVITDMIMPEGEGAALIMQLRRSIYRPPVIAISGGGSLSGDTYLHIAKSLGARATLQKPFEFSELLETVDRVLAETAS